MAYKQPKMQEGHQKWNEEIEESIQENEIHF